MHVDAAVSCSIAVIHRICDHTHTVRDRLWLEACSRGQSETERPARVTLASNVKWCAGK